MAADIYERLAQHLDNLPGGFPRTESGVEVRILRRLFTPEDAELALHLDRLTLAGGTMFKIAPHLASTDPGDSGQKVEGDEGQVKQGSGVGQDLGRVAIMAGSGAAIGGLADRSWQGAGIGGAAGGVVGFASALLTRGREVELRAGSTLDVVFDRAVTVQ